jgi:hypothetical protein
VATPNITLTATLDDLVGDAAGSAANPAKLRIALAGYGPALLRIVGTAMVAKPGPYFFFDIGAGISTLLWGNDQVTPAGTYYEIAVLDGDDNVVQCAAYSFTGGPLTIDLSNATPIGPSGPFSITSFTGGETVEVGAAVVNPVFAATYSTTPASANITNTDAIDSPHVLTTPFTAATLAGTFTKSTPAATTFTLSATQGGTQTATQTINWEAAIFSGIGTAGATNAVTAAGTTAVLSTADVLARVQLGAEAVGQVFGPFAPAGQVIYLLLLGGTHTFLDPATGFPFAINAAIPVTFVNAHGATVPMYLYQSTNPLFGTFNVKVAT